MMPKKAAEARAAHMEIMGEVIHKLKTEEELGQILKELENANVSELNEYEQMNIKLARKNYIKETKVPAELVMEMAKHGSLSYMAWAEAKANDDFGKFEPFLEKWVGLRKTWVKHVAPDAKIPYDVLLDEFDRDVKIEDVDKIFATVKAKLIPMIRKIFEAKKTVSIDTSPITGKFLVRKQEELSKKMVTDLNFDFDAGRFDTSVHPFTTSFSSSDVRITTRYREDDYLQGLSGSIHECGHSLVYRFPTPVDLINRSIIPDPIPSLPVSPLLLQKTKPNIVRAGAQSGLCGNARRRG